MEDYSYANRSVYDLRRWVIQGPNSSLSAEEKSTEVHCRAMHLAQSTISMCLTERQVNNKKSKALHTTREMPEQLAVGIALHQASRNKEMINLLHGFGLSVEYARLLRVETAIETWARIPVIAYWAFEYFMSKILEVLSCNEKVTVSTNHCLNYKNENVAFTVEIPQTVLRKWHDLRENVELKKHTNVVILNALIHQYHIRVKDSERINDLLRRHCSESKSKWCKLNGRAKAEFLQTRKRIAICYEELEDMVEKLEATKQTVDSLCAEKEALNERCEVLYQELEKHKEISKNVEEMQSENKHLLHYINNAGLAMDSCNTGKKLVEVQGRQQRRKLKELKTGVERALWFADTYGLKLSSASFCDENGTKHDMTFNNTTASKKFKDLPEDEQNKLKQILFIQDKFCIGEAAYHELCMTPSGESLPRTYLIRQCKESLDNLCHIERTPGKTEGAQVNFRQELSKVIRKYLKDRDIPIDDKVEKIKVKLSGDGARMTRLTGLIIISFAILNDEDSVMSSKGHHTVAVIKGEECYKTLAESCSKIFKEVNDIVKDCFLKIDEVNITIEMYLGGDYKFLLLIMGMKGATSDFACIWCKILKSLRYDMSKPIDFYTTGEIVRTIQDIKEYALKKEYSCEHLLLLNISIENIVIDELHLMLRVTDKLTKNLVEEALSRDAKDNLDKPPSKHTMKHLDDIQKAICSCGVSFSIWEKKNADGKPSGLYDFTSLMGSEKKVLLEKLPSKLEGVITPETANDVVQIWKDFNDLYSYLLQKKDPTEEDIKVYLIKPTSWVNLFTSLGGKLQGYKKTSVTPYMHTMVYHVPTFMKLHNGIKKFTGQGVEKLNDDCRRIHLYKSNKWDAAKDVLQVGKRLELLSDMERQPRPYKKKCEDYWSNKIFDSRSKRYRLCSQEEVTPPPQSFPTLTDAQAIKAKLKEMGIKTRIRDPKRLQDLYRIAMENATTT
ncbi:hypothetical protein AC249_AIPGENE18777 [Exaiptasia diaphana]|nr:hypothetical protein AC249_AIPGENE18777 [Exaiptasia diaphana]